MNAENDVYMANQDMIPDLPADDPADLPPMAPQPPPMAPYGNPYAQQTFSSQQMPRPSNGIPRFEIVPKRRPDGTYENVEYVDILTPGDPKASPRHKVTDRIRDMYGPWYQQWKAGQQMSASGTPLEMFAVLTPAQIHHMKSLNIFTVEQLAEVADASLHNIPFGQTTRLQAREFLKNKAEADRVSAYVNEKRQSQEQISQLQEQIRAQDARINALLSKMEASVGGGTTKPEKEPSDGTAKGDIAEAMADAARTQRGPKRVARK